MRVNENKDNASVLNKESVLAHMEVEMSNEHKLSVLAHMNFEMSNEIKLSSLVAVSVRKKV